MSNGTHEHRLDVIEKRLNTHSDERKENMEKVNGRFNSIDVRLTKIETAAKIGTWLITPAVVTIMAGVIKLAFFSSTGGS